MTELPAIALVAPSLDISRKRILLIQEKLCSHHFEVKFYLDCDEQGIPIERNLKDSDISDDIYHEYYAFLARGATEGSDAEEKGIPVLKGLPFGHAIGYDARPLSNVIPLNVPVSLFLGNNPRLSY